MDWIDVWWISGDFLTADVYVRKWFLLEKHYIYPFLVTSIWGTLTRIHIAELEREREREKRHSVHLKTTLCMNEWMCLIAVFFLLLLLGIRTRFPENNFYDFILNSPDESFASLLSQSPHFYWEFYLFFTLGISWTSAAAMIHAI